MFQSLRDTMLETGSVDIQGPYTVIPGPPAGWIPPIGASTNTWANIYENKQRIDYCTDQFAYLTNRCAVTPCPLPIPIPCFPPPLRSRAPLCVRSTSHTRTAFGRDHSSPMPSPLPAHPTPQNCSWWGGDDGVPLHRHSPWNASNSGLQDCSSTAPRHAPPDRILITGSSA